MGAIVPPPATLLLNAPQYVTAKALADAANALINSKLGGKGNVVLLTKDTMQFLTPWFEAMHDGLSAVSGVTIVADITPSPVTKKNGFDTMNTILLANPDIDVTLLCLAHSTRCALPEKTDLTSCSSALMAGRRL